jgi:ABC-type glycerol-3-phosphate transport system substrate-binding protein
MSNENSPKKRGLGRWLNMNVLGGLLLVGATVASFWQVSNTQKELFDPDATIIRISHWQLERGYSDALQRVINDYEKMWAAKGKKVRVLQQPVTEKVYAQWLNTHLIAGDAPDLSEQGMSSMLNSNPTYTARYYLPLTNIVNKPNPYNKGTAIEKVAWRETILDGMRGSYNTTLQDYYGVPTAFFTIRMFYNVDMMKEATGSENPPKTMVELLDACQKLQAYGARRKAAGGDPVTPIAGSKYGAPMFIWRYSYPFTSPYEKDLDLDLDGVISDQEAYIGFVTGKVSFDQPRLKAYLECLRSMTRYFGDGFYGMERQDAAFAFVQKRACMIVTGAWDASSLFNDPEFKVGVFDFPLPAAGDKYSEFILGRGNEAGNSAAGAFGVYKFSRNIDQAVDFLQFLSSQKYNQQMMREAEWIPAVIGTSPSKRMLPFAADPTGYSTNMNLFYGSTAQGKYDGKMQTFLEGQQTYEALAKEITEALMSPKSGGDAAWYLEWDNAMVQLRSQERIMAMQTIREMVQKEPDAELRYRQLLLQQVRANDGEGARYRFQQIRNKPLQDPTKIQSDVPAK